MDCCWQYRLLWERWFSYPRFVDTWSTEIFQWGRLCSKSNRPNPWDLCNKDFHVSNKKGLLINISDRHRREEVNKESTSNWKSTRDSLECREGFPLLQGRFDRNQTAKKRCAINFNFVLCSFRFSVTLHFETKNDIAKSVLRKVSCAKRVPKKYGKTEKITSKSFRKNIWGNA